MLIVDDSPTIATASYDELTDRGYDVDIAYNGKEAMARVAETMYEIIILDIEMPKMR